MNMRRSLIVRSVMRPAAIENVTRKDAIVKLAEINKRIRDYVLVNKEPTCRALIDELFARKRSLVCSLSRYNK